MAQPNQCEITWVPYYLFIDSGYDSGDCPAGVVDNTHCITEGLPGAQFSLPGDTVIEMGSEWQVLTEGAASGLPGVLVAEYGAGRILVEFGHPNPGALCAPDDAAMERYVQCTIEMPVATADASWSEVKARFR